MSSFRPSNTRRRHARRAAVAATLAAMPLTLSMAPALAASNGPSSSLTIARVFGGGGNSGSDYANDYVEVFNKSKTPVNLGAYSLQYAPSSGAIDGTKTTPLSGVSLGPGQYYLVAGNANGSANSTNRPLPTPDQSNNNFALSSTNATVFLVQSTTTVASVTDKSIVDEVGYGSTTAFEGTPTAALSNTTQATRNNGGCTDTDNNAADFTIGSASSTTTVPRNTSSPAVNCAAVAPASLPEAPYAVLLPLVALGTVGGIVVMRRKDAKAPLEG